MPRGFRFRQKSQNLISASRAFLSALKCAVPHWRAVSFVRLKIFVYSIAPALWMGRTANEILQVKDSELQAVLK